MFFGTANLSLPLKFGQTPSSQLSKVIPTHRSEAPLLCSWCTAVGFRLEGAVSAAGGTRGCLGTADNEQT